MNTKHLLILFLAIGFFAVQACQKCVKCEYTSENVSEVEEFCSNENDAIKEFNTKMEKLAEELNVDMKCKKKFKFR